MIKEEPMLLVRATLEEQDHTTIAADMGLSREGLRSRLTRIRKRLAAAAQMEFMAA